MEWNVNKLKWIREPKDYDISQDRIEITTAPHTDLWQRTYYHFRNDNAPVLQMNTDEQFFSFVVKTEFEDSHHRFDQCGIVMYLDSENWIKCGIEYENEKFQHLGSVVTNCGYSDWATTEVPVSQKSMWYRLSRREDDFCVECSEDGIVFQQMRVCHMHEAKGEISFGIFACSPEESSFKAVFTNMEMTECKWASHDGQEPDEAESGSKLTNKEIVKDFFVEGYVHHNYDRLMEIIADDYCDNSPCKASSNRECIDVLKNTEKAFPDMQADIRDMIEEDNKVTVRVLFSGTYYGGMYDDIPNKPKKISFEALEIFRIEDGKIVESWGYWPDEEIKGMLGK